MEKLDLWKLTREALLTVKSRDKKCFQFSFKTNCRYKYQVKLEVKSGTFFFDWCNWVHSHSFIHTTETPMNANFCLFFHKKNKIDKFTKRELPTLSLRHLKNKLNFRCVKLPAKVAVLINYSAAIIWITLPCHTVIEITLKEGMKKYPKIKKHSVIFDKLITNFLEKKLANLNPKQEHAF